MHSADSAGLETFTLAIENGLYSQLAFETCQLFMYLRDFFSWSFWTEQLLIKTISQERENNGVMSPEVLAACKEAGQN